MTGMAGGHGREFAVLTPSCAPDFELCRDLHRSVLRFTPEGTVHTLIVPPQDVPLFSELAGPRCRIVDESTVLPRSMVYVPRFRVRVNLRRPWPPIRGWVTQQLIKLQVASSVSADVVLSVDSDVELVRPVDAGTFMGERGVRLYRLDDGVHAGMPRHVLWHGAAADLLGTPRSDPPMPDYITSFGAFDVAQLRRMRERIERRHRTNWLTAVGAHLHFSEWITYGVHVDSSDVPVEHTDHDRCLNYWDTTPLDEPAAAAFLGQLRPDDVAVMISSESHTPLDVRRRAMTAFRDGL